MELKKDVGFFWSRATKKLSAKCNPMEIKFQDNEAELVKHFQIFSENEASGFIANEEIVHMRNKI